MSWNIAKHREPWRQLLQMDADIALPQEAATRPDDVARLPEAKLPPADYSGHLNIGPQGSWDSHSWDAKGAGSLFDR